MADSIIRLADVVIPSQFSQYTMEAATDKNAFFKSGIVAPNPQLASLLSTTAVAGGKTVTMPFTKPLSGDPQIPMEDTNVTINTMTTTTDTARRQILMNSWGENQLATLLSGHNYMDDIATRVSDWWSSTFNHVIISTCKGVFASSSMSTNKVDATSGGFSLSSILQAKFLLGDAHDKIKSVAMHSQAYRFFLSQDEIATIPLTDGTGTIQQFKPLLCGVLVDDAIPYDPATGITSIYMYGEGVFGYVGDNTGIVSDEIYRDPRLGLGQHQWITRRQFVLHPLGIEWNEPTTSITFPLPSDLEVGARWTRKKEVKNLPLVEYKLKIQ